jgi:hypothetical protein
MSSPFFESRDAKSAQIRLAMASVEHELDRLPATAPGELQAGLRDAWRAFVTLLAVDPPHELRTCPECGSVGMRAATRCSHCWTKLSPLEAAERPAIERGTD